MAICHPELDSGSFLQSTSNTSTDPESSSAMTRVTTGASICKFVMDLYVYRELDVCKATLYIHKKHLTKLLNYAIKVYQVIKKFNLPACLKKAA